MTLRERIWTGRCQRCDAATSVHTMSKFNTELICMDCDNQERQHPAYSRACAADAAAVRRGDHNFPGIGFPEPPPPPKVDDRPANIFRED